MVKKYLFVLVFVFLIGFTFAEFQTGESDILETYAVGSSISGWIEMDFDDQDSSSLFTDNFGNNVTLKEILEGGSYSYDCENNCLVTYSPKEDSPEISFTLDKNEEKFVGIRYYGEDIYSEQIMFNVTSNADPSSLNQLDIDILADGEIDFGNTNAGDSSDLTYSCYEEENSNNEELEITTNTFCQKFDVGTSPGFEASAFLKGDYSEETLVTLELKNIYNQELGSCELNTSENSASLPVGVEISCSIDYLIQEEDEGYYYVCLSASDNGVYSTMGYPSNCGFTGSVDPSKPEIAAYHIGLAKKMFGTIQDVLFEDSGSEGGMNELINDYLNSQYDGADCSSGCYVPISFISREDDQLINLEALYIDYDWAGGNPPIQQKNFYNMTKESPKINSGKIKIYLDEFFPIINETEDFTYNLKLNGETIYEKNIFIEDLQIGFYPMTTAVNFPIIYTISTPGFNATKYEWDFGSGIETTLTNKNTHTFTTEGESTVIVTVFGSLGQEFTQSFKVIIESPQKMINSKLGTYNQNFDLLEEQIETFTSFEKEQVEKIINITNIQDTLNQIESIKDQPEKEQEAINLILSLQVPRIFKSSGVKLPYFPDTEIIDTSYLQEATEYNGQINNKLESSIASWSQQNLDVKVSRKEFSKYFEGNTGYLFTVFEIDSKEIEGIEENYYLIVEDMEGLEFSEDYSFVEMEDYYYMEVTGDLDIFFVIREDIETSELPVYFSPKIESLPVISEDIKEFNDNRVTILVLIFSGLILVGIIIYLVLQKWYKMKYEKYLFKDRNYLFNMITYVNNSKKQGLDNSTIKKNLKKVGWDQEQIRYVMRKYTGKNTGMPRLSPRKLLKDKKENEKQTGKKHVPTTGRPFPNQKNSFNKPLNQKKPPVINKTINKPVNKYQNTLNSFRNSINQSQGNNSFNRRNFRNPSNQPQRNNSFKKNNTGL